MEADRASAYGGFLLTLIGPRNHKLNSALRLFLIPCLLQSNMQAGELPGHQDAITDELLSTVCPGKSPQ